MALNLTQLSADIDHIIGDLQITVTSGGESVAGSRSALRRDHVMMIEGLADSYRFSVYTNINKWTTEPSIGALATIAGTDYRILNKELDNSLQLLRLDLGEKFADEF